MQDGGLTIRVERGNARACLEVSGELDTETAPRLLEAFHRLGPAVREVELDTAGLRFVDSAGLRVLISAHELLARSGGTLRLLRVPRTLARLLDLTGLTDVLGAGGGDALTDADSSDEDRREPAY